MEELQQQLGYQFKNQALLELALTHPSKAYEMKKRMGDNQRLEFLGDAVLQLALTDRLYRDFDKMDEGELTRMRAGLVNAEALEQMALGFCLGDCLVLGRGETMNQGRTKRSNLADAMEAVIGAIYLDAGFEATSQWLGNLLEAWIRKGLGNTNDFNPKGSLQEWLQSRNRSRPEYVVVEESGPDHQKHFVVAVLCDQSELGRGSGSSKKAAEMQAAAAAYRALSAESGQESSD
ncbi:MAG: ribonuclease III [Blastochloris sp.]|nr:ribonuclease III [Blastochloris sp.]